MAPPARAPLAPGRPVHLDPPAVAMAWLGPGRAHAPMAVPTVRLLEGDILVEVELAAICGSDVHTVSGRRGAPAPSVLGHEYVGRIVQLNGDPRAFDGASLRPGDRIVWSIMAGCRECDRCRRGLPQKCRSLVKYGHERIGPGWELNGGFASHVHLRAGTTVVRVDEGLPSDILVPASCGTATAWAAVDRADQVIHVDTAVILIMGAGLIGLTATAIAGDRGARVIVADPDAARRDLALRFGAVAVADPTEPDWCSRILGELGHPEIDAVIEASGSAPAISAGLRLLGVGGILVLVGSVFPTEALPVDPERLVRRLQTIRGVHNYTPRDLAAAVTYLRERHDRHPFADLIGARFPLAELDRAVERAAGGDAVRVVVRP